MKQIEGGVTAAKGYTTAGTRAGIKKGKTNKDMAMIFSEKPAVTAGTFTKNLVKAAPVLWDKKVTDAGVAQAVVINTGIANALILKLNPKRETIHAVTVVPILAPNVTPTDCASERRPAFTKETTITVVAPDD